MGPDGFSVDSRHIAPANAVFEAAFSAFARGTLIATPGGQRAIEDLLPGMPVETEKGPMPIAWIGSMAMVPSAPVESPELVRMTRIMADTFGFSRPMPDLVLGSGARLLRVPEALREMSTQTRILTPAHAFVDGVNVIEVTPPTPVALFHLCLPQHAIIRAAGLEVETYHPGADTLQGMGQNMKALFMSLFPHLNGLDGFGPLAHPRAGQTTLESLATA